MAYRRLGTERRHYGGEVAARRIKGEVHFEWVLEGRSMQDVWIMPPRSERTASSDKTNNMYAMTFRIWDHPFRPGV